MEFLREPCLAVKLENEPQIYTDKHRSETVKFISFSVLSVFIRVNLWLISFLVLSVYQCQSLAYVPGKLGATFTQMNAVPQPARLVFISFWFLSVFIRVNLWLIFEKTNGAGQRMCRPRLEDWQ